MIKLYLFVFCFFIASAGIAQSVDFTYNTADGLYCVPSAVTFTQQSSGSPVGYVWDFGNNVQSNAANPTITFGNAGSYSVKLTVIYDESAVEVTKTILINPAVNITLGYDRNYICKPGIVNFYVTGGVSINSYTWDFGDGTPAVTGQITNQQHSFSAFGSYTVSVKATANSGCTTTASTIVQVAKPALSGTISPGYGCVPLSVALNAAATLPAGSTVTGYQWDFGDGTPLQTTATNNANHVYSLVGSFTPVLNITTSEGCSNSFSFPATSAGTPPANHIAYPKNDTICGSQTLAAVSKAINSNSYAWVYGDGGFNSIPDTITFHKYLTLGSKTLSVTPYYNGCGGTTITFNVFVTGIIASFTSSNTSCSDKNSFSFTNQSQGSFNNISWDFGDGTIITNTANPVHRFNASGSYQVKLTVSDSVSGCSDSYVLPVYVSSPTLVSSDTSVCRHVLVNFTLQNNSANPAATYEWDLIGVHYPPSGNASLSPISEFLGIYNNYVVINPGPGYCPDTIRQNVRVVVHGPRLDFSMPVQLCLNERLQVLNASQPFFAADSIRLLYWNFGESAANDSSYQPAAHKYSASRNYNVILRAIDKQGCTDSLVKPVAIQNIPFIRAIPSVDTICLGQNKNLIAFHSDSIRWQPAALVNCSLCDTVSVSPANTTRFYAVSTNRFGCSSSDSVLVKVYKPFTATATFTDASICLNDSLQLGVSPVDKKITWSPSTGLSSASITAPVAFPTVSTAYKAILVDSVGCFSDSVTVNVAVNTLPTVDAGPDKVYPFNATFSFAPVYTGSISSYTWSPATFLNCFSCAVPSGKAANTQTYKVTVVSDSGCIAKDSVTIFVECKNANLLMPGAFTPDNNGLNDVYYPLTRGIQIVKNFFIYNRFGQLVFHAGNFIPNNKIFGWNGKLNGTEQPAGSYIYQLEAICDLGELITQKGSFILIR